MASEAARPAIAFADGDLGYGNRLPGGPGGAAASESIRVDREPRRTAGLTPAERLVARVARAEHDDGQLGYQTAGMFERVRTRTGARTATVERVLTLLIRERWGT